MLSDLGFAYDVCENRLRFLDIDQFVTLESLCGSSNLDNYARKKL